MEKVLEDFKGTKVELKNNNIHYGKYICLHGKILFGLVMRKFWRVLFYYVQSNCIFFKKIT